MRIRSASRQQEAEATRPSLSIRLRRDLTSFENEYGFLGEYQGDLVDLETSAYAGKVKLFVVNLEGAEAVGWSAPDVLDLEATTEPYITLLGEYAGNFSPAVLRLLDEDLVLNSNMLIIDRVELLPAYRGLGLGLECMKTCLRHMSHGCRIAALKPYPLQFEAKACESKNWSAGLELSSFSSNQRASLQRLKRHYGQLGFKHVRGTELMVLDLDKWSPTGG